MYNISGATLNETIHKAFETINLEGFNQVSRNGDALAIFDTTFEVTDPRARHLHLDGRKSNIFQLIAETFWVLAGANVLQPYLTFFLPRAPQYSDDGETWHGAYGPRIYKYNQIIDAINLLKKDKDTRRAFVMIADPSVDNHNMIQTLYGNGHSPKDIPCNREFHLYCQGDQFRMKTVQRSGDMLFGAGSINPFEFSFIQELIYHEIKHHHPGLKLGAYRWHVTNAHVYGAFYNQVTEAMEKPQYYGLNPYDTVGPAPEAWEHMFSELISLYSSMISWDFDMLKNDRQEFKDDLQDTLSNYGVPADSLLRTYVNLVYHYIISKRGIESTLTLKEQEQLMHDGLPTDLGHAVLHSSFRKFIVE